MGESDLSRGAAQPGECTLHVVIPIFNEARNIGRLLAEIDRAANGLRGVSGCGVLSVILVDDGSTDGTADVIEAARNCGFKLAVLRHEQNRGPGAAFATAFTELAQTLRDGDRLLTMEGDNTSRLDTAARLLVRQKEGYDMVLASPYAYGGGFEQTSILRLVLSHGANGSLKALLGIRGFHTMSSFFRLYSADLIRRLQGTFGPGIVERTGFECMVELLIKAVLLKASISEVEMVLNSAQRVGKSKMKILRTIRGYLSLFFLLAKWERQAGARPWSYVVKKV